jgi:FkbM family methyltransferase
LKPIEPDLIPGSQLKKMDRWTLERRARALACPVYVGDGVVLCRTMGRYKLYVTTSDVGFGAHVMLDGAWESWLTVFMARLIRAGMHVVDVGANHGYYTMMFADLVGEQGRVAAIEPHPHTVSLLRRSLEVNGFTARAEVFAHAVGAKDGDRVLMYLPEGEPKNARVFNPHEEPHLPQANRLKLRSESLDTLLAHWPKVDFLKIDVEGAEEAVLSGLNAILERDRPQILLEFNVGRCKDPEGLIDRLLALYGSISVVTVESRTEKIDRKVLLDPAHTEDWLLYLAR